MNTLVITFLVFSCLAIVSGTQVEKCTLNNGTLPDEVVVKDCDEPPCIFYIGSVGVMTMKFRSPRYLENIAPKAQAILGTFPLGYPLDQTDACDGITNTPCPLAENEYIEYTFEMSILSLFPTISVALEFSLVDNDNGGEEFECFRFNLQIKKP